jgi:hypothetical protein
VVAQEKISIKRDRNFKISYPTFLDSMSVQETDFKTVDLELRIWIFHWNQGKDTLIQIQKIITNQWTLTYYPFYYYNNQHNNFKVLAKKRVLGNRWLAKWDSILEKGFLDLPSQHTVDQKLDKKIMEKPILADGSSYTIEILGPTKQRKIVYKNPESYQSFYELHKTPAIKYSEFLQLINLIRTCLNFEEGYRRIYFEVTKLKDKCKPNTKY